MWRARLYRTAAAALVGLALNGCSSGGFSLFATGTGIAVGAGVDHTATGIAHKTFAASGGELRIATLGALRRMDLPVVQDRPGPRNHAIVAKTGNRTIEIEIVALSSRTARMSVAAKEDSTLLKDAGTATEIIVQTAATLDDLAQRRQQARRPAG